MLRFKKISACATAFLACLTLSACKSAFVQTDIVNHTGSTVQVVEVDYPSASFGIQQIADNATYHYHFKIQDSGPIKISFTGDAGKTYTSTGPTLNEGQQGNLTITLESAGKVTWAPALSSPR